MSKEKAASQYATKAKPGKKPNPNKDELCVIVSMSFNRGMWDNYRAYCADRGLKLNELLTKFVESVLEDARDDR